MFLLAQLLLSLLVCHLPSGAVGPGALRLVLVTVALVMVDGKKWLTPDQPHGFVTLCVRLFIRNCIPDFLIVLTGSEGIKECTNPLQPQNAPRPSHVSAAPSCLLMLVDASDFTIALLLPRLEAFAQCIDVHSSNGQIGR